MKKVFLLLLSFLCIFQGYGQDKIDNLVAVGIRHHDAGKYQEAIEVYKEALKIDPDSPLVNYEISLSLVEYGDYETALTHCNRLITRDDQYSLLSYNTKGSCLNYLGRTDDAIQTFYEGLEKHGDYYLLHFNLGIAYHTKNDLSKAETAYTDAILYNSDHPGSHINLGHVMFDSDRKGESLLCLYYFLLLEPNTERSLLAYDILRQQLYEGETEEDTNELFLQKTEAFFDTLPSLERGNKVKPLWRTIYLPFFIALKTSGYTDVFCKYIRLSFDQEAYEWLINNELKVDAFEEWLEEE